MDSWLKPVKPRWVTYIAELSIPLNGFLKRLKKLLDEIITFNSIEWIRSWAPPHSSTLTSFQFH